MPFQEKDFVELDYTGFLKETNDVFDTTYPDIAKQHHLRGKPGKIVICLGRGHLLKGLEKVLVGKSEGKHRIELSAEHAFGKKNVKLINLVPTQNFIKAGVQPQPGLPVEIDGVMGTIKAVTGGRTVVDFNHPLSGKDVIYDVQLYKIVTDAQTQVRSIVNVLLGLEPQITIAKDDATITFKDELPKPVQDLLAKEIMETTAIKHVQCIKA
ncbi:FKBP-type peptidyl-prolyl cis-trans isomerase [Candidatus Woesearchaeota archaeon]|nr:FKBP-type peptidyl-prolyl cis-trans isomerase [Candidatus Woesearchaeota archaeon]